MSSNGGWSSPALSGLSPHAFPLFSQKRVEQAVSNSENRQVHYLSLNDATNFTGLFGVEMENAWRLNEYLKAPKIVQAY